MKSSSSPDPTSPVLVTGGLGFIGGHLVDGIVAATSNEVRILDNRRRAVCASKTWPHDKVSILDEPLVSRFLASFRWILPTLRQLLCRVSRLP